MKKACGSIFFLMLLLLIPIAMIVEMNISGTISERENKALAKLPDVFITHERFPTLMDSYINDRIGFKFTLLDTFAKLGITADLGSVLKSKAIIGKDNWLFLNDSETFENVNDFLRINKLSNRDIEKIKNVFQEVSNWCKANNIAFIVFIPPNKHNIYGEYYSQFYTQLKEESNYEKVIKALGSVDGMNLIPILDTIMEEKKNQEVYFRQDSHWNYYAGYAIYKKLTPVLSKVLENKRNIPIINDKDITFMDKGELLQTDLRPMLLPGNDIEHEGRLIIPEFSDGVKVNLLNHRAMHLREHTSKETNIENGTRIFILHDSYFFYIMPFLERSISFASTRWEWGKSPLMYEKDILEMRPDVLIWEMHERYLSKILDGSYKDFTSLNNALFDDEI